MKISKSFICILMAAALIFSLTTTTFAASAKNATTGGSGTTATTITIKTQNKTTLTFTQTKGEIAYAYAGTGEAYRSTYGDFLIYVQDQSGKEAPKSYTCSFKKSMKINLSAKKTYTVTITPRAKATTYQSRKALEQGSLV